MTLDRSLNSVTYLSYFFRALFTNTIWRSVPRPCSVFTTACSGCGTSHLFCCSSFLLPKYPAPGWKYPAPGWKYPAPSSKYPAPGWKYPAIACCLKLPVATCRCRLHHLLLHYNSIASSVSSQNVSSSCSFDQIYSNASWSWSIVMWSPCIVEHNTKLNSLVLTLMRSDQCDCVAHQIETAHWSRATQEKCWLLKVVGSIWCNQLGCISRRDILCKQPVTQSAPHPAAFILSNCIALYYFAIELSLSSPTAVHWVVQPVLLCSCNFCIKLNSRNLPPKL